MYIHHYHLGMNQWSVFVCLSVHPHIWKMPWTFRLSLWTKHLRSALWPIPHDMLFGITKDNVNSSSLGSVLRGNLCLFVCVCCFTSISENLCCCLNNLLCISSAMHLIGKLCLFLICSLDVFALADRFSDVLLYLHISMLVD